MELFEKILHSLTFGLIRIVDMFMEAFYFLAGIKNSGGQMIDGEKIGEDILSTLFVADMSNNHNINMTSVYIQFAAIAFGILCICFIVALLKSYIGKGDEELKVKNIVYMKTGQSVAWILFVPSLFMLSLWVISGFVSVITGILATSMGIDAGDLSIGKLIIESCVTGNNLPENWQTAISTSLSYSSFKADVLGGNIDNFNYWLFLLAGGCSLFGIMMTTLTLTERIIHIFFYYLSGPFIFAKLPLDQGKGFDQWKEGVLSKFFSLTGIILCAFLFFILLGLINKIELGSQATIIRLIFIIGGVFTFTKAGTLVANLISSNAGQFEGMSQNTSAGMLKGGMHIAGGLARGAGIAAMAGGGKGASGVAGAMAGGANALADATHAADGAFTGTKSGGNNNSSILKKAGNALRTAGNAVKNSGAREALTYGGVMAGIGATAMAGAKGAVKLAAKGIGKGINAIRNSKGGSIVREHNAAAKETQNKTKPKKSDYKAAARNSVAEQFKNQNGNIRRKDVKSSLKSAMTKQMGQYKEDRANWKKPKANETNSDNPDTTQ